MGVELVERLEEQVPERHEDQHRPERQERIADPQAEEQQAAGDQLHHRDHGSRRPEGPARKEGVNVGLDEETPRVLQGAQAEHLPDACHEEDEAEDQACDEQGPRTVRRGVRVHGAH